jgi:ribosome recycling factor
VADLDVEDLKRRMNHAFDVFRHELAGLRTGRASPSLLEPVTVEAYGSKMHINQVGNINVADARLLTVNVWDKSLVQSVDKAIRASGLGLNPAVDGNLIRIPIPELTQERRQEYGRIAGKYAEQARVAVRNVRRDGMEQLKKMLKSHDMSEDDHQLYHDEVQELTDAIIKRVDEALAQKEKEIMQV